MFQFRGRTRNCEGYIGVQAAPLENSNSRDLDVLFRRYSDLVFGMACRVLHDRSEAEEVRQEVFFYLHRRPTVFDPSKGSLKAWIVQVTFSRALDRKCSLARQRIFVGNVAALEAAERRDLETELQERLVRKHLDQALGKLTQMQRRTIESFYFDGLDVKEISKQLSQPVGNIRHYLYRGLKRLRQNPVLHTLL